MNCPSKDELILLHYKDSESVRQEMLKIHIKQCSVCRKQYSALEEMLFDIDRKPLNIDSRDIVDIAKKVEAMGGVRDDLFSRVKTACNAINKSLRLRVSYPVQLAFVSIIILLGVLVVPFTIQRSNFQSAVADLQLELVFDIDDSDFWLDFYST